MNWSLFKHSVLLAYGVAKMSLTLGTVCAIWAQTLGRRASFIVTAFAAISLALPPFLVANTWMHFFGLAGVWRQWIDFDLYSWGGAILLMVLLLWPVTFFLVRASLSRLETERIEADPLLKGWRLIRHVLYPHLRNTLAVASALSFVLALNHFSIPALLQTKVYSADVWVQFNSTFDYTEALRLGWPLIVAPALMLLGIRKQIELWRARQPLDATRFAEALGGPWRAIIAIISIGLLLTSVAFPLVYLASSSSAWKELGPVFAAGHSAFQASIITSLAGATVAVALALLLAKRRWSLAAWLPFFIPGVVLGILIIRIFNQRGLSWVYPSVTLVVAALAIRYLALPMQAIAQARRSVDPEILAAARADGASAPRAFWKMEVPILAGPIFFAWYIAYLFCLWDAETLVMIVPPGGETLSLRVFNMLHYGHTEQVNALCLWLVFLAIVPLVVRQLVLFFRNRSEEIRSFSAGAALESQNLFTSIPTILLMCAFALSSGCSRVPEGAVEIKSQIFSRVEILGRRGNGVGEFNKPRSVATDAQDNLYVVDMTGRVQKFSPAGQYLLSWQMPQTDKGKPKGMVRDNDGNIIVVEPHYNRLNYFHPDGSLAYQWGRQGTNAGELAFPRCVAINSAGETYIGEYGLAERVQRFSALGTNLLTVIGSEGEGPGQFRRAEGVGIDAHDRLFVADSCNHRVQVFSRDGKFIREHGKAGAGPGEMSYPYDVRVDGAGYEYVCEFGNSRIQIFDADGNLVEMIGGAGGEPDRMNNPWAICLDSKGNLYVADSGNHRVQKFVRRKSLTASKAELHTSDGGAKSPKGGGA
jgi:ABC-type Fe3+ transport system permease subunit/DNA-binding beta-propeller fold protein YncE